MSKTIFSIHLKSRVDLEKSTRKIWGVINPVSRVDKSKKIYDRKKFKLELE